jgi:hypothetical protein
MKRGCIFLTVLLLGCLFAGAQQSFRNGSDSGYSSNEYFKFLNESFPAISSLPLLRSGVQTYQQCSYDRAGDNYDHEYFSLYKEKNGELVIFDAYGPGMLSRQQMNVWHENAKGINIRYYFDDETTPRIDMDISTFFSKNNPLGIFREGIADDGGDDYRVMYCPMIFKKRLKVVLSAEPGGAGPANFAPWLGRYDSISGRRSHWYQYTYHLFTEDKGLATWSEPADLSPVISELRKSHVFGMAEHGNTLVKKASLNANAALDIAKLKGQGTIKSLGLTLSPLSSDVLFGSWIKIYFDNETTPSVNTPAGAFFGSYPDSIHSVYTTALLGYQAEQGMYANFPMPYWKSARIVIENKSAIAIKDLTFRILYDTSAIYPRDHSGYFHATFRRQFPRKENYDYNYLTTAGQGHVVGHNSQRWNTTMEENERTYFDGSSTPQVQGDGFEDDQGFGWGLKAKTFDLFGASVANGGSGSLYRFFLPDMYVFYSGIRHGHQTYGPHSPRGHEGLYQTGSEQSVTYYYLKNSPALHLTDKLDVGNSASEKVHQYRYSGTAIPETGSWWYDGEQNNVLYPYPAIKDDGRRVNGSSEFTVRIDPSNKGVRIRRRTDKANSRQLAKVYIDNQLVNERPWYTVDYEQTYKDIRWYDTSFEIPERYTAGKKQIKIKIEHQSSKEGAIDEYYYWVFSYTGK